MTEAAPVSLSIEKGANYQKVKSKVNKTIKINKSKIGTENKTV